MAILQWTRRSHNARVLHFPQSRSRTRKMIEGRGIAVGLVGPRPARPYPSYASGTHSEVIYTCIYTRN